jgi:hypothetical protein
VIEVPRPGVTPSGSERTGTAVENRVVTNPREIAAWFS